MDRTWRSMPKRAGALPVTRVRKTTNSDFHRSNQFSRFPAWEGESQAECRCWSFCHRRLRMCQSSATFQSSTCSLKPVNKLAFKALKVCQVYRVKLTDRITVRHRLGITSTARKPIDGFLRLERTSHIQQPNCLLHHHALVLAGKPRLGFLPQRTCLRFAVAIVQAIPEGNENVG